MSGNIKEDNELEEIASDIGVRLFSRYSEKEAATILGVSATTLQRIRLGGHISFLQVSERRIHYFGRHLLDYLLGQERGATCHDTNKKILISESEITGFPGKATAQAGSGAGLMQTLGRQDILDSARRILMMPENG